MIPINRVLINTLMVENNKMDNFSFFKSLYFIWMAPANNIKLSIISKSNSLKLNPLNTSTIPDLKLGIKLLTNRMLIEKSSETNINPIEFGNFKYLKFIYANSAESTINIENK